jgi:hypothetical protein
MLPRKISSSCHDRTTVILFYSLVSLIFQELFGYTDVSLPDYLLLLPYHIVSMSEPVQAVISAACCQTPF